MGSYVTTIQVRTLGGFSTSQISDSDLENIITFAESKVDQEVEVNMSASQKTLASGYMACAMTLERLASATSSSDGISYSLDRFNVNKGDAVELRNAQAQKFYEQYRSILRASTSGTGIIERVEG